MSDPLVTVKVLGPIRIDRGLSGEPFGPRLRRLLVRLVVDRGETVSESQLVHAVWPDDQGLPKDPGRALQVYVSRLRAHVGAETIERQAPGYRLVSERVQLDCAEFERLLAAAAKARARSDDRMAVAAIEEALLYWSGSAFAEFNDEDWVAAEAQRLDELQVTAREQRAELLLGLDDVSGSLVAELTGLAGSYPLREAPTRLLMLALYQAGRQADALAAFSRLRHQLATDLGLEPSSELCRLEERILLDDPSLLPQPGQQRSLRAYEIVERLGEGSFSIVYRGAQPSVGREVAIKQIRAELANRPEFIRRFETEAHLVARLEHPHIVPLIDYWREPGSAYLVMRLLRGGNLETAALDEPWSLERTIRMVDQIGAALSAAHRAGVVHRDVKPANILLDEDGNAYLSDFGIALEAAEAADPVAALSAGSPAYASPEQLRREPVGPSADIHGLAIAVYEALTGRLPFPDEPNQAALLKRQLHDPIPLVRQTRSDVPVGLDAVLQMATAKDPALRHQTVEEFVAALRASAGAAVPSSPRSRATAVAAEPRNPYKGLRAFDEADAPDFAGRERLIDQLRETLGASRLVAVVGPSGSGKSSVVRAGLLPELRRGRLPGSGDWFTVTLTPGQHPFEELENGLLRIATSPPVGLLELLTDGERGIGRAVRRVLPVDGTLLLVIDQFEELFTLCGDESVRRQFLVGLASAVTEERSRLRVVLTLRADFYDRPLRYEAIGRLMRDATVPVLPLAADELERAIVDPALRVGCEFEPGLVSEIVADVADQPGALPMVQYALTELYERQVSGLFVRDVYHDIGGVAGAVTGRAEDLYEQASEQERVAVRTMFSRLVALTDTGDGKRRAPLTEVAVGAAAAEMVRRFGEARLLSFDRDPVTREPQVEVAHESLIQQWARLQDWLNEDRDALRIFRHLRATAADWQQRGRPDSELYRGARLEAALQWATDPAVHPTPLESEFLAASEARRSTEVLEEQRANRRLRRLLAVVAVVAVAAVIAGVLAVQQQRSAREQAGQATAAQARAEVAAEAERVARDDAVVRRMISDAVLLAEEDPSLSFLVAAAAYRHAPGPDTMGALQQVLARTDGLLGFLGSGTSYGDLAFTDDRGLVARSTEGVEVWDLDSRHQLTSIDAGGPGRMVLGARLAVVSAPGGVVRTVDIDSGATVAGIDGGAEVTELAISPDGADVAIGRDNGAVEVRSIDGLGLRGSVTELATRVESLLFSLDGASLFVVEGSGYMQRISIDSDEVLWSSATDERLAFAGFPPASEGSSFATALLRFDHTGQGVLVAAYNGGTMRLDAATGEPTGYWPIDKAWAVDAIPIDDRRVVTGPGVIDTATGAVADLFPAAAGTPGGVAFAEGSQTVAVASTGGISLWSSRGDQLLARALPRHGANQAFVNPEGTRLATNQGPGELVELWDLISGEPRPATTELDSGIGAFWAPRPGVIVTSAGGAHTVARDADTLEPLGPEFPLDDWGAVTIDPSGRSAFFGGLTPFNGQILVYDIATGRRTHLITELDELLQAEGVPTLQKWVAQIELSPDGSTMAARTWGGRLALFEGPDWLLQAEVDLPSGQPVANVAFSHDGTTLAVQATDGEIRLLDAATLGVLADPFDGEPATTGFGMDRLLAFGPDDRSLLVGSTLGVQLWDLDAGTAIGGVFPNDALISVSPSANGRAVVTGVGDRLLLWNLETADWLAIACRAAGRDLTEAEWQAFGPTGKPFTATC